MMRRDLKQRGSNRCRLIVVAAAACALAACSTDSLFGSKPTASTPASTSGSFGNQFSDFFRGQPKRTAADETPQQVVVDCPSVEVREGAATYAMHAPGDDQSALSVRMQATFGQTARECHVNAGVLTIKVGVQGRIIVGPAGGTGDVNVPIRYAVVQEGVEPKTIWTKFYQIPVNVPPGSNNVPFSHVMEDIALPLPKTAELDAYVIYIGFDPAGLVEPKAKGKPKPKQKPTARTSSTTSPATSNQRY